jgi:hypothetical protein
MHRLGFFLVIAALLIGGGCDAVIPRPASEQEMFGAVSFRIHPTFTQIKPFSPEGKSQGIEAVLEFDDQFGDPTRASGEVRLELYSFASADPDHRGPRLAMWSTSLDSKDEQLSRWDPAARGYSFHLTYDQLSKDRAYVLTAQVDRNKSRLFDQIVIEPSSKDGFHGDRRSQHAPTNAPGHNY